jgi:hypothetical protein
LEENRQSYSRTIGVDHVAINICQFTAITKLNLALTGQNSLNGDKILIVKGNVQVILKLFFFIFEKQKRSKAL